MGCGRGLAGGVAELGKDCASGAARNLDAVRAETALEGSERGTADRLVGAPAEAGRGVLRASLERGRIRAGEGWARARRPGREGTGREGPGRPGAGRPWRDRYAVLLQARLEGAQAGDAVALAAAAPAADVPDVPPPQPASSSAPAKAGNAPRTMIPLTVADLIRRVATVNRGRAILPFILISSRDVRLAAEAGTRAGLADTGGGDSAFGVLAAFDDDRLARLEALDRDRGTGRHLRS